MEKSVVRKEKFDLKRWADISADGNVRYDEPEQVPKPQNVPQPEVNDVRSSTKSLPRDADGEQNGEIHQENTQTTTISNGPASSNKYKIVYFAGVRGRAEISRLILHAAGVPYDEMLISREEWQQMKPGT